MARRVTAAATCGGLCGVGERCRGPPGGLRRAGSIPATAPGAPPPCRRSGRRVLDQRGIHRRWRFRVRGQGGGDHVVRVRGSPPRTRTAWSCQAARCSFRERGSCFGLPGREVRLLPQRDHLHRGRDPAVVGPEPRLQLRGGRGDRRRPGGPRLRSVSGRRRRSPGPGACSCRCPVRRTCTPRAWVSSASRAVL